MKRLLSSLLALFLIVSPLTPSFAVDHALTHSKNAQDEINILDLTVGTCVVGRVLECVGISGQVGLGTDDTIATSIDDSNNNSVISILTLEHTTSGTPTAGIGSRLTFKVEDAGGTEDQAYLDVLLTDVTENSEDVDFNVLIQQAGDIEEIISIEGDNKRILLGDSNTALTNAVSDRLTLLHRTTGTPAAGFGLGLTFEIEDAGGPEEQGSIDVELDVVTSGSEEATMTFDINLAGTMTEVMRLDGTAGFASFGGVATVPAEAIEVENANATTAIQISNTATDGDPYLAWALSGTKAFSMGVDDGDSDKLKIGTTAIGTATMLEFDSSGNLRVLVGIDAIGAVDLDIGSADVTDVTIVTDGGTVVIDGSITQDAGTTLVMGGTLDATGAVDMDYGSGDITDHTFTTDGTGTAEVVLPAGSIDSTELLDGTILNADINSSAAIAVSKTALTAGTNITLSTNELNVDDAFLINNGNDTTTGTLTAAGYVGNLYDAYGAADLDIGSGDITDVTVVTDGGTVVIDGSITQDAGTTLFMGGLLDATGAVDMDYGSADITDHKFTTDGTGTAEIALPAGSIDSTELLDGTILNADINASAAIALSKTALVAGTNITLSTNQLNVDDAFLKNDTDDVTTGTIQAAGFNAGTTANSGILVSVDAGSSGATVTGNDAEIIIEDDDNAFLGIYSPDNAVAGVLMGSASDSLGAEMFWSHSSDLMYMRTRNAGADIVFATGDNTEAMRILDDGNVGMGIAAPDGTLHVHTATAGSVTASVYADDLVVENSTHGGISILTPNNVVGAIYWADPESNESGSIQYDHSANALFFHTAAAERMRVNATGEVSVGIAAGDGTFHIHTATAGSITANANADELVLENSGNTGMSILSASGTKGAIFWGDSGGDNEEAYIDWDGGSSRLGIATAKTGAEIRFRTGAEVTALTLDSTGLATFVQDVSLGDLAAVGSDPLCWDGSGASLIGDCTSLRQWKNNIVNLDVGLAEVLQLRAREFDWDEQHGGGRHDLGFVAEEVEAVSPLLVTYRPELTGVKYMRMTALLVKAIQELEARVAALE